MERWLLVHGSEIGALAWVVGAVVTGLIVHWLTWRAVHAISLRTATVLDDALHRRCVGPTRIIFPALAVLLVRPATQVGAAGPTTLAFTALSVALIVSIAWLVARLAAVLADVLVDRFRLDSADSIAARRIHTQVAIIRKVVTFVAGVVAFGSVLTLFEGARQLGAGLLASAGVAGVVVGVAAQRTLGNLVAGIQIAFTQPMRVDDVVVVEAEWGRIEEITLTYVVVRVWDQRRLVLPISYFIEKPFQNWTRSSAEILGTVFVHTDYTVSVDAVRAELARVVAATDLWDGKVATVQVTDCQATTVELRALVSAADATKAWDLRCLVREKLIAFLQHEHPSALPRRRQELIPGFDAVAPSGLLSSMDAKK